jgi:hypothetical protein
MGVPTALATLATLERRGFQVAVADSGRLTVNAPRGAVTADLAEDIRTHRDLIVWTLLGRITGHQWCPCDACGQAVLLDPQPRRARKLVWPKCRLTLRCPGRYTDPKGART